MKRIVLLLALLPFLAAGHGQMGNRRKVFSGAPPTSPVAGMSFWFSADCISFPSSVCGVPTTGTTLTTWADRSGNANNLTVGSGTCTFNTAEINSLPAVTFSSCKLTLGTTVAAANGHTAFVVYETTASSGGSNNHFIASQAGGFEYQLATTGSAQNLTTAGGTTLGSATNHASSGTWTQSNVYMTNAASAFAVGFRMASATDTLTSSTSQSITANGPSAIGCYVSGGSCVSPFLGKIAEVIYYNTTLTLTQIQQNEAYFRSKYGIS